MYPVSHPTQIRNPGGGGTPNGPELLSHKPLPSRWISSDRRASPFLSVVDQLLYFLLSRPLIVVAGAVPNPLSCFIRHFCFFSILTSKGNSALIQFDHHQPTA